MLEFIGFVTVYCVSLIMVGFIGFWIDEFAESVKRKRKDK